MTKNELEALIGRVNELELARAAEAPRGELVAAEARVVLAAGVLVESDWARGMGAAIEDNLDRRRDLGEDV